VKIALTGAGGQVGSFIAAAALGRGDELTVFGRRPLPDAPPFSGAAFMPWQLGQTPDLRGFDALIHAAFAHLPGRYRGGEGDDPARFIRDNLQGSLVLFRAAADGGVGRALFLSSRAVFDGYPPGTRLTEDLRPQPASLYGEVKAEVEDALIHMAGRAFRPVILRATGVYGRVNSQLPHKWQDLIQTMLDGLPVAPRISTEVHGADLADGAFLALEAEGAQEAVLCHASDLLLDRRDLVLAVSKAAGRTDIPLPERQEPASVSALDCMFLQSHGWAPGGWARLREEVRQLLPSHG